MQNVKLCVHMLGFGAFSSVCTRKVFYHKMHNIQNVHVHAHLHVIYFKYPPYATGYAE